MHVIRKLISLIFEPTTAAFWSAFAATCAALSSFLIMLIHRRNLLEMIRPELVLTGWVREEVGQGDAAREIVTFQIKNVGRGIALDVYVRSPQFDKPIVGNLTADMEAVRVSALGSSETVSSYSPITLWWKNINEEQIFFMVAIRCYDTRGRRYDTQYSLDISKLSPNIHVAGAIAPNLFVFRQLPVVTPAWRVNWKRKKERVRTCLGGLRSRLFRLTR